MKIHVLGSAAGGGFPQWNCNCSNCNHVRNHTSGFQSRTQSSIAIQGTGEECVLINASPDILKQIQSLPLLQPGRYLRDTAIAAVLLMDGQVDHTTGLFMLREGKIPLQIWCTKQVQDDLELGNPIFKVLGHFCGVHVNHLPIDKSQFVIPKVENLAFYAIPLQSKPAPYSPHRENPVPGDNIGLIAINQKNHKKLFYAPGLGEINDAVWQEMLNSDCVMVDGTFWRDDEMVALGISKKYGLEIGHLHQSGVGGMLSWLEKLPKQTRKILIHINNTNPILNENSEENKFCQSIGVEIAYDGMEIEL